MERKLRKYIILTKESCAQLASKFNFRADFYKAHRPAFDKAKREGFLDEICAHMPPKKPRDLHKKSEPKPRNTVSRDFSVGEVVGKWTVLETGLRRNGKSAILLQCSCGFIATIDRYGLSTGTSNQCKTCAQRVVAGKRRINSLNRFSKMSDAELHIFCVKYIFPWVKRGATERGLEWNVSVEEFAEFAKKDCHYCDSPPINTNSGLNKLIDRVWKYNGIDRQDNSKGYVAGNMVTCCIDCNESKSNKTLAEWQNWLARASKKQGLR